MIYKQLRHIFSHGHRESQACGADAGKIHKAIQILPHIHMESLRIPVGPQAAVLGNGISYIDVWNQPFHIVHNALKALRRHALIRLIVQILRSRAYQHVSVNGRTHQLALCHLGWNRKHDVLYLAAGILI